MKVPSSGPVVGGGRCPRVGAGIISTAGIQIVGADKSAPDDHLTASPHCGVILSAIGCAGGADGCPTVGAGIIFAAGVKIAAEAVSAPDDHFTAGPHCGVIHPGVGCA